MVFAGAALLPVSAQYFQAGNLVVTRSVYSGTAGTVTVGSPLPGGGVANATGAYPGVFSNEAPDPSFGVTSPIFVDQITKGGVLVSSLNVTATLAAQGINLSTSFPSKSELAINQSVDGRSLTFLGYAAAPNSIDVSNSNTPGVFDPSNPVSLTYQRSIGTIDGNGNVTATPVNAYSGNNGRAAILGNGNYYLVGNAGGNNGTVSVKGVAAVNGSSNLAVTTTAGVVAGMPVTGTGIPANTSIASVVDATHVTISKPTTAPISNGTVTAGTATSAATAAAISQNTGIQIIPAGNTGNTTVVGVASGNPANATGYQNGFNITQAGLAADKTGKDNNFRGETVYNGTLYVSKGSGSNGINSIYQVNPNGGGYVDAATGAGLATVGNAATSSINLLPGLPANGAKDGKDSTGTTQTVYHPFGIWFANATTMYVADEGTGKAADIGTANDTGGLQKWTFGGGLWHLAYTLRAGLNIGVGYNVANGANGEVFPSGLNVQTDGLRNLTGEVNPDGTVNLYAITSTVSLETDQGADPNKLVYISDALQFTSAAQASGESFSDIETAVAGEVLRGVAMAVPEAPANAAIAAGIGAVALLVRRRFSA